MKDIKQSQVQGNFEIQGLGMGTPPRLGDSGDSRNWFYFFWKDPF